MEPCRDCRAFHHRALGEGQQQFWNRLQRGQFSTLLRSGQCPFGTTGPPPNGLRLGRSLGEWLVLRIRARRCDVGPARAALETVSRKTRFWHFRDYNKGSSREGTLSKAIFRPVVSFPPASARSGLPPPEPPTCLASACISLPAWTLAVRSLVTPAISATLPSSGMPSATTPEPSFCLKLSTSCLSPSRSTFCTSAAITLIPLTSCTRPASSSIWLSAPLRFCASSSFSSCLAVWASFSTCARMPSSPTLSWLANFSRICACCW